MPNLAERYIYLKNRKREEINLENDATEISSYFFEQYGFFDDKHKPFLINSFHFIGWADPFPEDGLYGSNDQMLTNDQDKALNKQLSENPRINIYP